MLGRRSIGTVVLLFLVLFVQTIHGSGHQNNGNKDNENSKHGAFHNETSTQPDEEESLPCSYLCPFLTKEFSCSVSDVNKFSISCHDVDLKNVSKYLPIETKVLKITYSNAPILSKPLFPHLEYLESLELSNNHHRFITSKPFTGLDRLKHLDLSSNDITVVKMIFLHTPNLEKLDLSNNKIIDIGTITNSLKNLRNLNTLILNHNPRIQKILNDDFQPISNINLTQIFLFNTTIQHVDRTAFEPLRCVKTVDLSVNYIGKEALFNVTSGLRATPVQNLTLRFLLRVNEFPFDSLVPLENTSVTDLNLGFNHFPEIGAFPNISSLQHLSLRFCALRKFHSRSFTNLTSLVSLDVARNEIDGIYDIFYSLSSLKTLSIYNQDASNFFMMSYAFKNMRNLTDLNMSNLKIGGILHRYMLYGLRGLKSIYLHNIDIHTINDFSFETLESLEILYLEANSIRDLTNFTFSGLNNLRFLTIGSNQIRHLSAYTFRCCPKLEGLFLHRNFIKFLPENTFYGLPNLKSLFLYQNKLKQWNRPQFAENSSIEVLNLARNSITYVTEIMLEEFTTVTKVLDLSGNPFNCSMCGTINFLNFMNESSLNFSFFMQSTNDSEYVCASPRKLLGHPISDISSFGITCVPESNLVYRLSIIVLCSIFIGMSVIITITCYFLRWYIRYWVFHIKARVIQKHVRKCNTPNFVYDAFVSYNSADAPWVVTYLIPELEEKEPPLKLCIHERDFEVGKLITENILEAIAVSKKVILVLSDEFVKSEWCMFELHMAQHKLFDDTRDELILIKLKAIDKALYSKELLYLEKTRTSYMWSEDPKEQIMIWKKLRKSLGMTERMAKCDELTKL